MVHIRAIGHSTRSFEEFIALLREHDIQILVEVRSSLGSQRYPDFNRESSVNIVFTKIANGESKRLIEAVSNVTGGAIDE